MHRRLRAAAAAAHLFPTLVTRRPQAPEIPVARPVPARPGLVARLGHERVCAVVVAGVVAAATAFSVAPPTRQPAVTTVASVELPATGPVGGPRGSGAGPRLVVGGAFGSDRSESADEQPYAPQPTEEFREVGIGSYAPNVEVAVSGPFLEDGTLLKPVSVNTVVPDAKDMLRTHKVKSGDTLESLSKRYDVKLSTIWWANKLKSRKLKAGQVLTIPPVNGLVVTVGSSDTLASLAKKHKIKADAILETNKLEDSNLVIGQVLILPGAKGEPVPKPKPKTSSPRVVSGGAAPSQYTGGRFAWPVAGGYISQYYHYGHYGIDIAADPGTAVKAAATGKVIFAGWKNNGGGYQVHISHGSGLYTTYNHMSSLSVSTGQSVGRGKVLGGVGSTGYATGPHLHFEVWVGGIWNGGRRVNPLGYL